MNGKKLLDTNAVIALQAKEPALLRLLEYSPGVLVPSPVVSELYYGAYNSRDVESNLRKVDDFVQSNDVLGCDAVTARICGRIRHALKLKGRPIPINDLWIAAIAVQHSLTLVTRDAHFYEIEELQMESW
jgi:tRNA(fMet)-specific endonuclease VapC